MYPAINFYTNNQMFSEFLNDKATSANIEKIRDFYNIQKTKKKLVNTADNGNFSLTLETNNPYIYNSLCLNKNKETFTKDIQDIFCLNNNNERLETYAKELDNNFKNYFTNQNQNIKITSNCSDFYSYQLKLDFNK